MNTLLAALLMQYVVSVKAGLVNHVQGTANVTEQAMVRAGSAIRTAEDGYAEILLTPGAFLRIGENSAAVLESVELENVKLRIVTGPAVIEVIEINKKYPIHVTTGDLTVDLIKSGIYRFEDESVTVLQGKLRAGPKLEYGKGWQVFYNETYSARRVGDAPPNRLDVYSEARSAQIAEVNLSMASRVGSSYRNNDYWMFDPFFGMYTYLPRGNYRSPYGFPFYAAGYTARSRAPSAPSSGSSGGGNVFNNVSTTNTNSGNNNGGNTSTGSAGGGVSVEQPRTVQTPSGERMTPAAYIESKNPSVPNTE